MSGPGRVAHLAWLSLAERFAQSAVCAGAAVAVSPRRGG
jgi:hypothetical protein